MAENPSDRAFDAASRLYDLAVEYADRSHAAQAQLVRGFEIAAAALTGDVGELVIDDDDDERLVLSEDGHFTGRVLVPDPEPTWESLQSADDIVDYYDPVDLFDDLADCLAQAFPGVAADDGSREPDMPGSPDRAGEAVAPTADPWLSRLASLHPDASQGDVDGEPGETATMKVLRDLHAAGVYTDAEFAAKKAELDKR